MDGGEGGGVEEVFLDPCDGQMVSEVLLHILVIDSFKMATGHDTGCQGLRGTVGEFIDEEGLTRQDDGQIGFRISLELGDGVEFMEDIEAKQGGLIDDEGCLHLFPQYQFLDFSFDEFGQVRPGSAGGAQAQLAQDLTIQLQDGAGGCGEIEGGILGGVELTDGISQGGGFSASDIPGDQSHGADAKRVVKAFFNSDQLRGLEDLMKGEIGGEGFPGQGEERAVAHCAFPPSSVFDQSFPPRYLDALSLTSTSVPLWK